MVASSPMQRWRKPPILALACISPARSSKRRMSIIFERTVRQVSSSGRSCLTSPNLISSALATSAGDAPSPLPAFALSACAVSLVAIASESTRWPPAGSRKPPIGGSRPPAGGLRRSFELVVAPEDLAFDHDARDAADALVVGLLCRGPEAILRRLQLDALEHGV